MDIRLPWRLSAALVVNSSSSLLIQVSFSSCSSRCNIVTGVMAVLSQEGLPFADRGWSHSPLPGDLPKNPEHLVHLKFPAGQSIWVQISLFLLRVVLQQFRRGKKRKIEEIGELK